MILPEEELQAFYNRLEDFIAHKSPSNRKGQKASFAPFEQAVGVPNATFSGAVKSHKNFQIDRIMKINAVYPELDMNWLFSGEGDMLKENYTANQSGNTLNNEQGHNMLNNTSQKDGNSQVYSTGNENIVNPDNEMIKFLQEQLKEKDKIIADKDKRIEKLTDRLLGD